MKKIDKVKAAKLVENGAVLVDIRTPVAYRDGTISGAINLPYRNFLNKLLGIKPTEKYIIFSDSFKDEDIKNILAYAEQLKKSDCIFVAEYRQLL